MQDMAPFHSPDDDFSGESAARRARLQQLLEQAQRVLTDSRIAVAAHNQARERMSRALCDARARLEQAHSRTDP